MKIIILAAGIGSRLQPLTQNIPKSLLKLTETQTVLQRTIDIINKYCKCDIVIVAGYMRDKFEELSFASNNKIIFNPFFRVTNSVASLWFAKEYMDDDTIIINADVVMEESLFKEVLRVNNYATVFYDSSIGDTADYKVACENNNVIVMSKELKDFSGEYVGITKLSKEASIKLRNKIEKKIEEECINEWYETVLVDMIFNDGLQLKAFDACNYQWTEIDTVNDLIKAKKIVSNDKKDS